MPARLCGVEKLMGTIERGKLADLTVVKGESYFNPDSKISAVWIDGKVYDIPAEEPGEDVQIQGLRKSKL